MKHFTGNILQKKLLDFNIEVQVVAVHPGPVITRFEIDPAPGVKANQITNLARDLARALSVISLRVVENIPGKSVIGLEIPNEFRETVRLKEGLSSQPYEEMNSVSPVWGKEENWRIARRMSKLDLQGTDLGAFLDSL